jgi:hypothetical protein
MFDSESLITGMSIFPVGVNCKARESDFPGKIGLLQKHVDYTKKFANKYSKLVCHEKLEYSGDESQMKKK